MVAGDRNENKIQFQDTLWLPRTVVQKKKRKMLQFHNIDAFPFSFTFLLESRERDEQRGPSFPILVSIFIH